MTLDNAISRRLFVHVGGYDPKTADAFFARLDKELARFETTWNVRTARGPVEGIAPNVARSTITATGRSGAGTWRTVTDVVFLSLEPIVQRDFADPPATRAARYARAFADYWTSGTAPLFFRHAWRFSLYFLYPALALLFGLLVLATLIGLAVFGLAGLIGELHVLVPLGLAVVATALAWSPFLRWWGRRKYILHLADLWSFSSNWLHGRRPDAEALFDGFGRAVAKAAASKDYDEIVLLGHSTGGAIILDVAHRALAADPDLRARAQHVNVLTVGSTALKIGLHPKADWFRRKVQDLHDAGFGWCEYQSIQDIINFEGTDPAALMGLRTDRRWPVAHRVRMKRMLEPQTWARIRRNVFRVHYQFVFANTLPFHYDYPHVAFGPVPLQRRAAMPDETVAFLLGED